MLLLLLLLLLLSFHGDGVVQRVIDGVTSGANRNSFLSRVSEAELSLSGFNFAFSDGSVVEPLEPLKDADEMQSEVGVLTANRIQTNVQIL